MARTIGSIAIAAAALWAPTPAAALRQYLTVPGTIDPAVMR